MTVITIKQTHSGNVVRKIRSLQNFLRRPVKREQFNTIIQLIHNHWKAECYKTFSVRRSRGLATDNLMGDALGIDIKDKNKVIVYVKPVKREAKTPYRSSGGRVENLTSILFRGTRSSFGGYSPRWDCRVKTGVHPGISAAPMRNMWNRFKDYSYDKVKYGISQALKAELKKK